MTTKEKVINDLAIVIHGMMVTNHETLKRDLGINVPIETTAVITMSSIELTMTAMIQMVSNRVVLKTLKKKDAIHDILLSVSDIIFERQ